MASPEGSKQLAKEKGTRSRSPSAVRSQQDPSQSKVILLPVAIPGCGKTCVAIALTKLFGFGHTQSDDVAPKGKKGKTAAIFEANVRKLLETDDVKVVVADK